MSLLYCGKARLSRNKIRDSPGVDLKLGGKISATLLGGDTQAEKPEWIKKRISNDSV
ncbi:MAG TPA: hypothetical protein VHS29_14715 [Candidatus Acidoferrales bacterium]|jgi:hypothetical protein|nr:hypothetical protein [Candidatus Acidoferrales bacterium]